MPHCEYTLPQRRKGKKRLIELSGEGKFRIVGQGALLCRFGEGTCISMCRVFFVASGLLLLGSCLVAKAISKKTHTQMDVRNNKKKVEGRQKMGSFVRHNVHHSSPDIHPFMWQFFSICILISFLLVFFLHPISSYLQYVLPNILPSFSTPISHFLLLFSCLVSSYSADDCLLVSFLSRCTYIQL